MKNVKPLRTVTFDLSSLGYAVSRGFKETMAPFDLEPREFAVLRHVGTAEGEAQQAIAARLQIPPSRLVAIVDGLERRGLLERRAHATDRRVRELYLTSAGRSLLRDALDHVVEFERQITAPLSAKERDQLLGLLERIGAGLGLEMGAEAAHAASAEDRDAPAVRPTRGRRRAASSRS